MTITEDIINCIVHHAAEVLRNAGMVVTERNFALTSHWMMGEVDCYPPFRDDRSFIMVEAASRIRTYPGEIEVTVIKSTNRHQSADHVNVIAVDLANPDCLQPVTDAVNAAINYMFVGE